MYRPRNVVAAVVALVVLGVVIFAASDTERFQALLEQAKEKVLSTELTALSSEGVDDSGDDTVSYRHVTHPLAHAPNLLNRKVQVVLTNGSEVFGTLEEVRADALVIRRRLNGGTMSGPVQKSRIVELQELIPLTGE